MSRADRVGQANGLAALLRLFRGKGPRNRAQRAIGLHHNVSLFTTASSRGRGKARTTAMA